MCVRTAATTAAIVTSLGLAGCSATAQSGRPHVVAGLYPYAFVANAVGGRFVDVTDLTSVGSEPHDLELPPQQVAAVTDADLVVYQRGFQPALDQAVDQSSTRHALDVGRVVRLDRIGGAVDPHVWLDPTKLAAVATAIGGRLTHLDPAHADRYRASSRALVARLQTLDQQFRSGLRSCARSVFVPSHAAFGYLAKRYGLRVLPIEGVDPHAEPVPERQARVADAIRSQGLTTIFTEPLASSAAATSLAAETGVRVATLDPVEGLSATSAQENYFSLMRSNLAALRRANGCR